MRECRGCKKISVFTVNTRRYCDDCRYSSCPVCGSTVVRQKKGNTYCSHRCHHETLKRPRPMLAGENHPNWKGGIPVEEKKARKTREYKDWKKVVYARSTGRCVLCDTELNKQNRTAHHLKSFREFPELRYDPNNGVALCRSCHIQVHSNGWWQVKQVLTRLS